MQKTNKLLRLPRVMEMTGCSRSWIYQQISRDNFPKPILLGERSVAWIEEEVQKFIKDRITKSRQSTI